MTKEFEVKVRELMEALAECRDKQGLNGEEEGMLDMIEIILDEDMAALDERLEEYN